MRRGERDLTTSQAARLARLGASTIRRAVDAGALRAYRVPGSTHRRIRPADLRAWCERHGVPMREE
jgi:excisionase family DNA binding protein